jgi:soluble lytic murein transglycosylase-like protein
MNLGQLLGGAGVVGSSMRAEEDAQRQSRQKQLQTDEMNRLDQLRQEMLRAPMPTPQVPQFAPGGMLPVRFIEPPAAPAAPVAPGAAPATGATTTPVAPQPTIQGRTLPPVQPTMPQSQADRLALLRAPTAIADVIQAPAAGALNVGGQLVTGGLNLGSRLVNAVTGQQMLPTDRVAPQFSLTPFYDRYIRQPEQVATEAAQAQQRGELPPTPAAQLPEPQRLLQAMITVESAGKPGAVSPKGAVGLMQVMPASATNPGYGLPNVFDFAEQMGTQVGKRNETEAKRLLADPAVGAAYGQRYMDAMLQRYNGNLEYALAAYNAGPGRVDKWLAAGADFNKLPKETREYIPKVLAALAPAGAAPAAAPAGATPVAPVPAAGLTIPGAAAPAAAPAAAEEPFRVEVSGTSQFYLANPQSIPMDMQRAMQQRAEVERLAGMFQRAGMGAQFMEARAKLLEADNSMTYLQGMQGLQEFTLANDPRRLAAVWSQYAGVPIGIQPRTDGKFDIIVNGRKTKEGMTALAITDSARSAFDQTYRQQQSAASSQANMDRFKTQLKVQEENAKQQAEMIKNIYVERAKGNIQLAVEQLKMMRYDVKPTGAGDGTVVITPPGSNAPFIFNPSGRTIEVDGVKITSNAAYPISGLPSYGGVKP